MNTDKKRIVIKTNGPIWAKGGTYGPITIPYMEEVSTIFRMIADGLKVYEVIGDQEVELTVMNYDQVLDKTTLKPTTSKVAPEKKVEEVKHGQVAKEVEVKPVDPTVETEETMEKVGEDKRDRKRDRK